ncbi:MAG TPA: HlyD family efflux transporter periplasmic adaptor subunit [Paucimonas sp.]|nr:HlyD family efflux transporter periplasmic adaptor subunit [Paucimonas sp.]
MAAMEHTGTDAAVALLELARRARHVERSVELDFMAVNATHALAPYRQAALWFAERGVCALSGVVQIEANAPYAEWLGRLCRELKDAGPVAPEELPPAVAAEWAEWLPAYGLWLPLAASGDLPRAAPAGGILLARDIPWLASEIAALTEWADILRHAYLAHRPAMPWSLAALKARVGAAWQRERSAAAPWWRRRSTLAAVLVAALLLAPVRLTVLAPGELVPAHPVAIRSPLDGVIERFHVAPNQLVRKGQPLFDFDEAQLASRHAVASQALATAEAEYRQSAQQALNDGKSKALLTTLQGKIEERRAETEFLAGQVERAHVTAPQDGIVLFDDPDEWIGRPVATGERIMRIAAPREVEVEAWLALGDAIALDAGAEVQLYLSAAPLAPVAARVRHVSYEAVQRPDGGYAYRVRARLGAASEHRIGLKGTAKLSGRRVPLIYWMLRRPLAAIRETLGW